MIFAGIGMPGCRANKHPVQMIIPQVMEAGSKTTMSSYTAYYSRKEEGSDILLSAATSTMNCHEFPVDLRSGLGQHGAPILHV
jgi:hypothetical protein